MTWATVLAYAAQVAILAAAGSVLPRLLRLRDAPTLLRYHQLLLLACLLLPVLQPWSHRLVIVTSNVRVGRPTAEFRGFPVFPTFHANDAVLPVLAAGVALRLLWLGIGLWGLRRYRTQSRPLEPLPETVITAQQMTRTCAEVRLCSELPGPVTFGWRRPLVLFPARFLDLPVSSQLGVVCHELIHVRRHDWAFGLMEECISALLWFHPAVWWLNAQIRLSRERTVDESVVAVTAARERYIDALLALSEGTADLRFASAQPFLTRSHLVQRIESLMTWKDGPMSPARLASQCSVLAVALTATAWIAVLTFPLAGSPQVKEDAPNVRMETQSALLHRSRLEYPLAARRLTQRETVTLELNLAQDGSVEDGQVVSGPADVGTAALRSVLDWHFVAGSSKARVSIEYTPSGFLQASLPPATNATIGFDLSNVPEPLMSVVRDRLLRFQGQPASTEVRQEVERDLGSVDKHFTVLWRVDPEMKLYTASPSLGASPPPSFRAPEGISLAAYPNTPGVARLRVGGDLQATKRTHYEVPVYPALAKQARIQGVVRLNVLIDKTGRVSHLELVSGHPLLVPSAIDSVKEWTYSTTLLNGNPAEVVTVVDVNFTLSE
ncbi:MAG: M56 family metallopeptidase [Bryobacteraceae bacterium]